MDVRVGKDPRPWPDWRVYADATCAGLASLIPIPLLDLAFERAFRRRIGPAIARRRGVALLPEVRRELGRGEPWAVGLSGCLVLPLRALKWLAVRIWRKLLYVLAVAEAVEQVGAYWLRAALVDHMARTGRLSDPAGVRAALAAFQGVLAESDVSPLQAAAGEVVAGAGRVGRTLMRARRRGAAEVTPRQEAVLHSQWIAVAAFFERAEARYEEILAHEIAAREAGGEQTSGRLSG